NNCGQRFPSVKINEVKGGCNPAPLTRTSDGDTITINEKDILADGGQYF
ncbi:MAG: Fe-S-containing protein, partial [Dehalococcoidia bacterium]|nr:Fe-S-containing protein [Dehalococcoidia bacterium]